jgi:hypothetical protein
MLFFIVVVLGFLSLSAWGAWHYFVIMPQERAQLEEMRIKAEQHAKAARPFQDYVASLQPAKKKAISFKIPFLGSSSPTFSNLRRFTSLTFGNEDQIFYVKDDQGTIYGPAEGSAILTWIAEERIMAHTLLSNHETGPWLPARQIKMLRLSFEKSESPSIRKRFENIQINK